MSRKVEIIGTESRSVVCEGNGSVTLDPRFNDQPTFGQYAFLSCGRSTAAPLPIV